MKSTILRTFVLTGMVLVAFAVLPTKAEPIITDAPPNGETSPALLDLNFFPASANQATRLWRDASLRHMVFLYTLAAEIVLDPPHLIAGADNRLILRLHNGQDTAVAVGARVRLPDDRWHVSPAHEALTVDPEAVAETNFTLTVPPDTINGKYDATIELEAGRILKIEQPLRVNTPLTCLRAAPTPTVDGDLVDWAALPATVWAVAGDTTAEVRAQWAEDGLYFAFDVHTPTLTPGAGHSYWAADSLEIFLDPDASGGEAFDAADRQYWFLAQGPEGTPLAGVVTASDQAGDVPKYALSRTAEGYAVEVHIPADQLATWPPQSGTALGCDFKINDPDSPLSDETYFSGAQFFGKGAYGIPRLWGWLTMDSRSASGIVLSADTPGSDIGTFALGEPVKLSFNVTAMTPGQKDLQLNLRIVDEMDRTLKEQSLKVEADATGKWATELLAPCDKMGFYRVFVQLSNGLKLPELGVSRRAGYITYAVVPDPTRRKLYGEKESFFGLMGPLTANVIPHLGVRWVIEPSAIAIRQYGYAGGQMEPDYPGQFADDRAAAQAEGKPFPSRFYAHWPLFNVDGQLQRWEVYTLPTLFMSPPEWAIIPGSRDGLAAALNPDGEQYWRNYCIEVAKAYAECYPDREEHIYQITWEPQGFPDDEALIRIYQIAYEALHETDPKAVVIGPTSSASMVSVAWDEQVLSKGLGKYLDGYSVHPYLDWPNLRRTPEQNGLIEGLRTLKAKVQQYTGKDLPMFATEQGFPTARDPSKELLQARSHIRSNLILLGEGYRFHISFISYDFGVEPGYGFFYNLSSRAYTPDKVSPKPVVPAYAAMTFLLDGHKSTGPIEGLGDKAWGYTYQGPEDVVMALWSEEAKTVAIPMEASQVEVFDWMGNSKLIPTHSGTLQVMIGPNPIYVRIAPGSDRVAGD